MSQIYYSNNWRLVTSGDCSEFRIENIDRVNFMGDAEFRKLASMLREHVFRLEETGITEEGCEFLSFRRVMS